MRHSKFLFFWITLWLLWEGRSRGIYQQRSGHRYCWWSGSMNTFQRNFEGGMNRLEGLNWSTLHGKILGKGWKFRKKTTSHILSSASFNSRPPGDGQRFLIFPCLDLLPPGFLLALLSFLVSWNTFPRYCLVCSCNERQEMEDRGRKICCYTLGRGNLHIFW